MIKVKDLKRYEEYIIEKRRDFHKHPEVGFKEFRTSKIVRDELLKFGFKVIEGVGVTGIVGLLIGNNGGKTILLRADMDALNVQEQNDIEYKSINDGIMHACGHDTHTAMLLGACKYFSENLDKLNGTLKVVFQSAEEVLPGGGISVVNEGHLDDVDVVFGQHIFTIETVGTISIKKGAASAAADCFKIEVIGIGTHASAPETGKDPVLTASQIIIALQNIISRNISPLKSAVISVTTIHSGTVFNIIPEKAILTGTIRTLNNETRFFIFDRLKETAKSIAELNGCIANIEIIKGYPPLINDYEQSDFVIKIAQDLVGIENVKILDEPLMGGEDFAYYLEKRPGCFLWLGGRNKNQETVYLNHNPKFNIDESSLLIGTAMHINIVQEYLK